MAAQVLPASSGGSFLNSPVFEGRRNQSPAAFNRNEADDAVRVLHFDVPDSETDSLTTGFQSFSLAETPDSGCSCAVSKTPEVEFSPSAMTPTSSTGSTGGMGCGHRKRKTVTIDESQTSIVVISPDDLFNTYSRSNMNSADLDPAYHHRHVYNNDDDDVGDEDTPNEDVMNPIGWPIDEATAGYLLDQHTGWPLKRSQSLESRDNPFLPGGDLSKEAEDLLSKATIIRDQFFLNEEEKKQLQQQQLEEERAAAQHRSGKHVQIVDDGRVYSRTESPSMCTPHQNGVEERMTADSVKDTHSAPPVVSPDDVSHPRENGGVKDSTCSPDKVRPELPDGDGQSLLPATGDSVTQTDPQGPGEETDKKRRNKCCAVM